MSEVRCGPADAFRSRYGPHRAQHSSHGRITEFCVTPTRADTGTRDEERCQGGYGAVRRKEEWGLTAHGERGRHGYARLWANHGEAAIGPVQRAVHLADCGVTGMHTRVVTMVTAGQSKQKQEQDGAAEGSVWRDWAYVGTTASSLRFSMPGVDEDSTRHRRRNRHYFANTTAIVISRSCCCLDRATPSSGLLGVANGPGPIRPRQSGTLWSIVEFH